MAFAGRCGLKIDLSEDPATSQAILFNEELGAVIQVRDADQQELTALAKQHGINEILMRVGHPANDENISISHQGTLVLDSSRVALHRTWSETTYHMQSLRDHPDCAQQEYDRILDGKDPGLNADISFTLHTPTVGLGVTPKMAILREQGVNGQIEMAAAFDLAGFEAIDVTMSDLVDGRHALNEFQGVCCLRRFFLWRCTGCGVKVGQNRFCSTTQLRDQFEAYFSSEHHLVLGICNGCQMLASLSDIIPGTP